MQMLKGIGASPGVAIGKVFIKTDKKLEVTRKTVANISEEIHRLDAASETAKGQIREVYAHTLSHIGPEEAKIFEAHLLMMDDPELFEQVRGKIKSEKINAEWSLMEVAKSFLEIFEAMDDAYLKERAADLRDVTDRVMKILTNTEMTDLSNLPEKVIVVADDLTPSDTATMDKSKVIGFLTNIGGLTSHSSIMARILEIPAVVGLKDITERVRNGEHIAFNGDTGAVIVNPDEEVLLRFSKMKEDYDKLKKELECLKGQRSITLDGRSVELVGNIGTIEDIPTLLKNDAEGVGLFRTEFVYMDRTSLPTEEEQFKAYKTVLEAMNPKPVVIRTLDIGGDKELPYFKIKKEMNPFLGYRAIRLCLQQQDIFKTQLRALLRASIYGKLKIMFPMISSLDELLEAKKVLDEVKSDLDREGTEYRHSIEVGMMIEVPSAAIISDILAKHVDFFSIGTNDLIQYTCAVDRMNEAVQHLYNPFNPAVLRLIKMVIENGHKEGIWVGMCGELAGDKRFIPILLGMGLDEFSMSPSSILQVRKQIRELKYDEAKRIVEEALSYNAGRCV